jgi:hypothetical protein
MSQKNETYEDGKRRVLFLILSATSLALALASMIGMFFIISSTSGVSITSVILFLAGIVAISLCYIIIVAGGIPLPGPKKKDNDEGSVVDNMEVKPKKPEIQKSNPIR